MPSWLPENNTPLPQDPIERSLKKINDLLLIGGGGGVGAHTHDAADIVSGTLATVRLGSGTADATTFLRGDQTWAVPAASGAPVGAQYLTLAADATLTAERVLTGTANQVILTDAGAGSTLTLSLPQSIATTSTPQFLRLGLGVAADATAQLKLDRLIITTQIEDASNNELLKFTSTASAVNELTITNAAATGDPSISATGGDTNIDIQLIPKGTGGILAPNGSATLPSWSFINDPDCGLYRSGTNSVDLVTNGANRFNINAGGDAWVRGGVFVLGSSADVMLRWEAAGTLSLRNLTNAQRFRVYNTFTTLETSGEWFAIDWQTTANVCNMWTKKGSGAGTARNLGLGTDGVQRWSIHATTGLLAAAAGVELQLGNAAAAGAVTPTHTVTLRDSTGTLYRVPCLV